MGIVHMSHLDVKGYIKDKLLQKSLKIGVTDGFCA